MRPVLPSDISAAARALMPVPPQARAHLMARVLDEAEAADRYRKRFGRNHALWGNGTLMAAALARPLAKPPHPGDRAYLECQFTVLQAVIARQVGAVT